RRSPRCVHWRARCVATTHAPVPAVGAVGCPGHLLAPRPLMKGKHPMCPCLPMSIFGASMTQRRSTPGQVALVQHARELLLSLSVDAGRGVHSMLVAPTVWLAAALTLVEGSRWRLLWLVIAGQLARWKRNHSAAFQCQLHRLLGHVNASNPTCTARRHQDLADARQLLLGSDIVVVLVG